MTDILQLDGWEPTKTYDQGKERITEAFNGVAKVMNREGRGYTFSNLRARLLVRNKLLIHDGPQDMVHVISPIPRNKGTRCECCGGVFEPAQIEVHHITPLAVSSDAKVAFVCATCHRRFHTEWAKHGMPLST